LLDAMAFLSLTGIGLLMTYCFLALFSFSKSYSKNEKAMGSRPMAHYIYDSSC